eukprot:Awhi_evm1s9824
MDLLVFHDDVGVRMIEDLAKTGHGLLESITAKEQLAYALPQESTARATVTATTATMVATAKIEDISEDMSTFESNPTIVDGPCKASAATIAATAPTTATTNTTASSSYSSSLFNKPRKPDIYSSSPSSNPSSSSSSSSSSPSSSSSSFSQQEYPYKKRYKYF